MQSFTLADGLLGVPENWATLENLASIGFGEMAKNATIGEIFNLVILPLKYDYYVM